MPRTESQKASRRKYRKSAKAKALRAMKPKKYRSRQAISRRWKKRGLQDRAKAQVLRAEILIALGGTCAQCTWNDVRALQIDHVQGDGRLERSRRAGYYRKILRSIRSNEGKYQLLCANHNWIKPSCSAPF